MKPRFYIGIDPGKHTGLAVWDSQDNKFVHLETLNLWKALKYVENLGSDQKIKVIVEDARQRRWYGPKSEMKQQGAGSIKRDCVIWEEFLSDNNIPYEMIHPIRGCTKWSHEQFKSVTGWKGRTSDHARDAGMMVYGR